MPIKGTYYNETLGAAPTTFTQLGKTYSNGSLSFSASLNTFNQLVYSPATGVTGNFLTPGIYTMSIYAVIYVDSGSTYNGSVGFGIITNSSTNPSGGAAVANPISLAVQG
jgi:hypothetical protein